MFRYTMRKNCFWANWSFWATRIWLTSRSMSTRDCTRMTNRRNLFMTNDKKSWDNCVNCKLSPNPFSKSFSSQKWAERLRNQEIVDNCSKCFKQNMTWALIQYMINYYRKTEHIFSYFSWNLFVFLKFNLNHKLWFVEILKI